MLTKNIYEKCPVYETASFMLRLVRLEDAQSLLARYSDEKAVSKINDDSCTSDFYYTTIEEMEDSIKFWLKEYNEHRYVRFAIIPKTFNYAVGTVEIFGGEFGVLRIDIAVRYDKEEYIEEFIRLAVLQWIRDFQIGSLKIKVSNAPERIPLLKKYGFVPSTTFRPQLGYYERPVIKAFDANKGIAYCGLACCVCSENKNCKGCQKDNCQDRGNCKNYNCCKLKNLEGCWECSDFPCDCPMLAQLRVKTFSKYVAENSLDHLIHALKNNEECGVIYHYSGQLTGDYDLFQSEEEIIQFINRGL